MQNLNYLMDHIMSQIFKIISKNNRYPKSIKIYVNQIENRIIFEIKRGYYLQLLASEIMKLLGSTKKKITKDENGEKVPRLEINVVIL